MKPNLFFGKTEDTKVQLFRNVVVECVRYTVNMWVLWFLNDILLGAKFLAVSTVIASVTSGLVNFILSSVWVFHKVEKKADKSLFQFVLFTAIGAVGLGINVAITTILTNRLGLYYLVSNTIAQIVVFFFNFFARKKIVFERGK
ncbi:MAG: GtrA family protein [Bacteroidales bacterium]|nr:GtrA family protein [Bacteroidales bacterium]